MGRAVSAGISCATRKAAERIASNLENMHGSSESTLEENLVCAKKQTELLGVTLYREADRAFSRGDRVQITAPNREQRIANRELGTVENIDTKGNLRLRLDSGSFVSFNIKENPHLDYGYAVTSHSSQGRPQSVCWSKWI